MPRKSTLEKVYKVECRDGYYLFKLNSLIEEKGRTKNSVRDATELDFNTIQRMIKGDLGRIDLDVVAKLCNELDCKIEDLFEYVNVEKETKN